MRISTKEAYSFLCSGNAQPSIEAFPAIKEFIVVSRIWIF